MFIEVGTRMGVLKTVMSMVGVHIHIRLVSWWGGREGASRIYWWRHEPAVDTLQSINFLLPPLLSIST